MARVTSGKVTHARHKKVIKAAKGYYGARKNAFRTATQAVEKQINMQHAIVKIVNGISVRCGSNVSTQLCV